MSFIKFAVKSRSTNKGTVKKAIIERLKSNVDPVGTNELPIILNMLSSPSTEEEENDRFPFRFPFKLL